MIALVTGASSGIGAATARRIAREPGAKPERYVPRPYAAQAMTPSTAGDTK